jgi:hypothetical protein
MRQLQKGECMKKIILLLLAFILTACFFGSTSEFDKNLQKWQDAHITHYRYSLNIVYFGYRPFMPITVEVQNGKIISMNDSDGTPFAATDYDYFSPRPVTIDGIFATLEAGLAGDADEVTVKYDPTYSFPTEIYLDYSKGSADDELSFSVSNFEVLK